MFTRFCAGISIDGIATEDLTVNLANKDCEVAFDILLSTRQLVTKTTFPEFELFPCKTLLRYFQRSLV